MSNARRVPPSFLRVNPDQNRAVMRWIRANSLRPVAAANLWAELFCAVDADTGEVMLSRDQLAELVGISSDHVSEIMVELESISAIIRPQVPVPGMRGPGIVRYFMSPLVATNLTGRARDAAQAEAAPGPLLRVMEGGKAP